MRWLGEVDIVAAQSLFGRQDCAIYLQLFGSEESKQWNRVVVARVGIVLGEVGLEAQ